MSAFIYPIESIIYTLLVGPMGMVLAWYSIYLQSSTISQVVVSILLLPYIQKVAYEAVLSRESNNLFVRLLRAKNDPTLWPLWMRIKLYLYDIWRFSIFPMLLPRMMILFLINLIPIIGPILVFYFRATTKGYLAHRRYFILKGYNRAEMKRTFKVNKPAYVAFGLSALLLEMIPCFNLLLVFTNTIGAALWAVDLENNERATSRLIEDEYLVDPKREFRSFRRPFSSPSPTLV